MSKLLRFQVAPTMIRLPRGVRRTFDALTYVAPSGVVAGDFFEWMPAAVAARAGKSERQVRSDMVVLIAVGFVSRVGGRIAVLQQALHQRLRQIRRRLSPAASALVGSAASVLRQWSGGAAAVARRVGGGLSGLSPSVSSVFGCKESLEIKGALVPVCSPSLSVLSDRGRLSLEERRAQAAALLPSLVLQSAMNGAGSS